MIGLMLVLLHLSGQPQTPTNDVSDNLVIGEIKFTPQDQFVQFPVEPSGYIRCPANPGTLPLSCVTSNGERVTIGIIPRAADETDGKVILEKSEAEKAWGTKANGSCLIEDPPRLLTQSAEPIDVPAVLRKDWQNHGSHLYTCSDKSRILLPPDGNGKFWCHQVTLQ